MGIPISTIMSVGDSTDHCPGQPPPQKLITRASSTPISLTMGIAAKNMEARQGLRSDDPRLILLDAHHPAAVQA
jgi:hypothetical protein